MTPHAMLGWPVMISCHVSVMSCHVMSCPIACCSCDVTMHPDPAQVPALRDALTAELTKWDAAIEGPFFMGTVLTGEYGASHLCA